MAPIVNDSDEEGDLDDFAGGEVENEALPSCDDHTRDDRTQGTRPTGVFYRILTLLETSIKR